MKLPYWAKYIKKDDLPERFYLLAEIIGLRNTLFLIHHFQGEPLYLPKFSSAFKEVRDHVICHQWRKHNIRQLSQEFGLSFQAIRDIVKDGKGKTNSYDDRFLAPPPLES